MADDASARKTRAPLNPQTVFSVIAWYVRAAAAEDAK